MSTTVTITLGHDNLSVSPSIARAMIRGVLGEAEATLLGEFLDGTGHWEGETETCDAWVVAIPSYRVWSLAADLEEVADFLNQDAIGYVVHDHATRPNSYVSRAGAR